MSFFKKIGEFFEGLFNAAKKSYNGLSNEQQQAILTGSGLVDVINDTLDKLPNEVVQLIESKFPEIKKYEGVLAEVSELFGLELPSDDLLGFVVAMRGKIDVIDGPKWAVFSHSISAAISILVAPKGTKLAQVVSVIEWAYQVFFKKSIAV